MTSHITSLGVDPSAMRTPISRVRSETRLATTAYSPTEEMSSASTPKNAATVAAVRDVDSPLSTLNSIVMAP